MKIQRLKGLFWLGSFALGGYLVYYVVDFLREKPVLEQGVSIAKQKELLESIKKPAERENDVIPTRVRAVLFTPAITGG